MRSIPIRQLRYAVSWPEGIIDGKAKMCLTIGQNSAIADDAGYAARFGELFGVDICAE